MSADQSPAQSSSRPNERCWLVIAPGDEGWFTTERRHVDAELARRAGPREIIEYIRADACQDDAISQLRALVDAIAADLARPTDAIVTQRLVDQMATARDFLGAF